MASSQDAAVRTTASMLAEISCGTAAELVMAVRYTNAPPGLTFIPALDDILREARGSDSSTLRRGDMVELIGPSGSGKTAFILFLLLTRLLPPSITIDLPPPHAEPVAVPLGGRCDQATILIPTSHRSLILQLAKHLRQHITGHVFDALTANLRHRKLTPILSAQIDEAIRDSLSRLRVIKIKPRWKEMALALERVLCPPELVLEPEKENTDRLDLLIIDGFADGFWPERWHHDERTTDRKVGGRVRGGEDIGLRDVMAALEGIRKDLGAVVVLSLQALWPADNLYATHLPPPYPAPFARDRDEPPRAWPLNIQITLTGRKAKQQLPPDITLVDALRTLDVNKDGQAEAQAFEGIVRVPGGKGVAGTLAGVKFELRIGQTGVEVWS